jgi:hypothetical protein
MAAKFALTDLLRHKTSGQLCTIVSRTEFPSFKRGKTPTTIYTVKFWKDSQLVRVQYNEDDLELPLWAD